MDLSAKQRLYLILSAIFVTSLLSADTVAGKFFSVWGLPPLSTGTVVFPIAFLLTDIVNEYYGQSGARFMTWVGMGVIVLAFAIYQLARFLPVADISPVPQQSVDNVFGLSARLFGASLAAYLVSQFVDIHAFHLTKRITQSKHLWVRALGSTVLSQVIDTLAVNFGSLLWQHDAHGHEIGVATIFHIATISYFYKIVVATILTPLVYVAHEVISKRMGIEPAPHEGQTAHIHVAGA